MRLNHARSGCRESWLLMKSAASLDQLGTKGVVSDDRLTRSFPRVGIIHPTAFPIKLRAGSGFSIPWPCSGAAMNAWQGRCRPRLGRTLRPEPRQSKGCSRKLTLLGSSICGSPGTEPRDQISTKRMGGDMAQKRPARRPGRIPTQHLLQGVPGEAR